MLLLNQQVAKGLIFALKWAVSVTDPLDVSGVTSVLYTVSYWQEEICAEKELVLLILA